MIAPTRGAVTGFVSPSVTKIQLITANPIIPLTTLMAAKKIASLLERGSMSAMVITMPTPALK